MSANQRLPILYSFRRCPYAMRARLGLVIADLRVELREILLKDKPDEMLAISAKATVPVLQLANGQVLDESLDIIDWALAQAIENPRVQQLLNPDYLTDAQQLIAKNDGPFKANLDRYKYASRFPERSELEYRQDCEEFLTLLESRLNQHTFLCSNRQSLADIAIFPFIRQFAGVDRQWFDASPYKNLREWLKLCLESDAFNQVMKKFPLWNDDKTRLTIFPE